jgi:hypothetical protein
MLPVLFYILIICYAQQRRKYHLWAVRLKRHIYVRKQSLKRGHPVWEKGSEENNWIKREEAGENCIMKRFLMCRLVYTKYYYGDSIKDD